MSDFIAIETLINDYFQALHHKDVAKIEAIFWDHASITGYYEGEFVHSKLHDYLSILKRMSAPNMIGEDFDMAIKNYFSNFNSSLFEKNAELFLADVRKEQDVFFSVANIFFE